MTDADRARGVMTMAKLIYAINNRLLDQKGLKLAKDYFQGMKDASNGDFAMNVMADSQLEKINKQIIII